MYLIKYINTILQSRLAAVLHPDDDDTIMLVPITDDVSAAAKCVVNELRSSIVSSLYLKPSYEFPIHQLAKV